MELSLTTDEAAALRDVLDSVLGDMSMEIADTDNPAYRRQLRAQRDLLVAIRSRLEQLSTTA